MRSPFEVEPDNIQGIGGKGNVLRSWLQLGTQKIVSPAALSTAFVIFIGESSTWTFKPMICGSNDGHCPCMTGLSYWSKGWSTRKVARMFLPLRYLSSFHIHNTMSWTLASLHWKSDGCFGIVVWTTLTAFGIASRNMRLPPLCWRPTRTYSYILVHDLHPVFSGSPDLTRRLRLEKKATARCPRCPRRLHRTQTGLK